MAGVTLPVHWESFTANRQNEDVLLQWKTAMEWQSDKFIVQHSLNGVNWKSIGERVAAGNSSATQTYELLHTKPGAGVHYYRIVQTDLDGKTNYSSVNRVQIASGKNIFQLFPNPAANTLFISRSDSRPARLEVYNLQGRLVLHQTVLQQQTSIALHTLSAGMYKAVLITDTGREQQTFIKK